MSSAIPGIGRIELAYQGAPGRHLLVGTAEPGGQGAAALTLLTK